MVYRPGGRDCSQSAAASAPLAKMPRSVARWVRDSCSPGPAKSTVCSPTMSPARTDAKPTSPSRCALPRPGPAPEAPPAAAGICRASRAAAPSARAVPEGASCFERWCTSRMSTSKAGGSARAAMRTNSSSSVTPRLVWAATSGGMSRAAAASARSSSAANPVVPISSGLRAARHAGRLARVAVALLKSIATSASVSARGRSLMIGRCRQPTPATSPASRPRLRLVGEATAPVMLRRGNAGAARSSAWPMRPLTPMRVARTRVGMGAGAAMRALSRARVTGKEALHTLEKAGLAWRVLAAVRLQRLLEPPDQLALLGRQMHRCLDDHAAEQVTARAAAHRFHALVAQSEHAPGLGFGGDLQLHVTVERRHRNTAAERRGGEAHRHFAAQVLTVALEDGMFAHVHFDIQVPGRTAVAPGFALARQSHAIAIVDSRGHLDRQLARAAHPALPEARVAGIADDGARPPATRTGLLQLEEALRDAHLPCATAGVAGGRSAALGRTAPVAYLAFREPRDFDLDLVTEHGLRQLQLQLVAQIGAAEHLWTAAAACPAEDVPEHITEDVAEGVAAESAAARAAARAGLDAGVTVLVVGRPLMRVGQHLAGFLRLLEGLLRLPVVGITIRVILHREAPVGLLDLGLSRCFRYVQYLVEIALRHLRCLRGLASLILYLFELRIHHILAARAAAAAVLRARRSGRA